MACNYDPFIILKAPTTIVHSVESKKSSRKERKNCWTWKENLQYIRFFEENPEFINSPEKRKECKIFNQMGKRITTRLPVQIKSHHQKLLIKFRSIENIISELRNTLPEKAL